MVKPRLLLSLCAVALAAAPAEAQLRLMSEPDSEWELVVPPADPGSTPETPVGPTTPEGDFSTPERVKFVEKMREHVLDQLCRSVNLQAGYNLPGDFSGTGGKIRRWLAPLPDGRLTVVDEQRISVGYGHGLSKALGQTSGASAGLWAGGRVDGGSMVVRPLQGKATCKELDTLIDLRDIKTVLPFKAARVSAMRVGELWRIPYTLTVGYSASVSAAIPGNLAGAPGVSLSFGGSQTGESTLTLYRLSDSQLRFRFRIDRVVVRSAGGQIVETIPAVQYALTVVKAAAEAVDQAVGDKLGGRKYPVMAGKALTDLAEHEIVGILNGYVTASLGLSRSKLRGKRVLLEYILDPREPAQAEAVAQALHGDFASLVKMAWELSPHQAIDENTEAAYLRMKALHDEQLGRAAYAAINSYEMKTKGVSLGLPFVTLQNWAKLKADDEMERYDGAGGRYAIVRADKSRASEYVKLPYLGPVFKDNVQRNVQVVTQAKPGQDYGDPMVVYLQQHGFLHERESAVRRKALQFSELMALAGTRGGGPNPRMAPPLAKAFGEASSGNPNRKGSMAFTLVFSQEGVKQLAAATALEVLKAYAAVCEASPALSWLLANAKTGADGNLIYDEEAADLAFPDGEDGLASDEWITLESLAKEAAGLVADLLAVRDALDNRARSAALAKAFAGYDKALRVFIQLVDPLHITGDLVVEVDRPKGRKDLSLHYVLKKGRAQSTLLQEAGEAKARFAQPSILTD